jgi:hypothetical protein
LPSLSETVKKSEGRNFFLACNKRGSHINEEGVNYLVTISKQRTNFTTPIDQRIGDYIIIKMLNTQTSQN